MPPVIKKLKHLFGIKDNFPKDGINRLNQKVISITELCSKCQPR